MPLIDDILELDLLTLRAHTELAGDVLDPARHRELLAQSLAVSETICVRRNDRLVAYAMLRPQAEGQWFVYGFGTHPDHRDASIFRDLFAQLADLVRQRAIAAIRSNVYKTNRLSMAFHRRLGFKVTRENEKGVEFTASVSELSATSRAVREAGRRRG